jgi:hypothetical protein
VDTTLTTNKKLIAIGLLLVIIFFAAFATQITPAHAASATSVTAIGTKAVTVRLDSGALKTLQPGQISFSVRALRMAANSCYRINGGAARCNTTAVAKDMSLALGKYLIQRTK